MGRLRAWQAIGGAALAALGVVVVERAVSGSHDFDGFHAAARHLLEHGSFSTSKDVARYPPSFVALHLPLAPLPVGVAAAVWYLLNVAASLALPRQLERLSDVPLREQVVAWLVMAPFLVDNLLLGQSGPALLWLGVASLASLRRSPRLRGGLGLGAGALFKLLPGVHLLVPVVLGRARAALAGAALALVLGALLVVAAGGPDEALSATGRWLDTVRHEQTPWGLVAADRSLRHNNQGLGVTLARTLGDLPEGASPRRVALASWPLSVVWTLLGAIWLACVLCALPALLAAGRQRAPPAGETWLGLFALTSLGALIASPVVWTHYFLGMLPGLVALRRRRRLVAIGGTVLVVGLAVEPLRSLGLHVACCLGLFVLVARQLARHGGGES